MSHDRTHSNQASVLDGAPAQGCFVTDCHIFPDDGRHLIGCAGQTHTYHCTVLNIGSVAHVDWRFISCILICVTIEREKLETFDNSAIPNRGTVAHRGVSDHGGIWGDPCRVAEYRPEKSDVHDGAVSQDCTQKIHND